MISVLGENNERLRYCSATVEVDVAPLKFSWVEHGDQQRRKHELGNDLLLELADGTRLDELRVRPQSLIMNLKRIRTKEDTTESSVNAQR